VAPNLVRLGDGLQDEVAIGRPPRRGVRAGRPPPVGPRPTAQRDSLPFRDLAHLPKRTCGAKLDVRSFNAGLRRAQDAVTAGFALPYSSGIVEARSAASSMASPNKCPLSDVQRTVTGMTPMHAFVKAAIQHFPRAERGSAQNAFRAILAAVLFNALGRRPEVALADAYALALRCVRAAAPEWAAFLPRFV